MQMKIESSFKDIYGKPLSVTVTYSGQDKDKIGKTTLDEIVAVTVDLNYSGSKKIISYAGHGYSLLGSTDFIPSQINSFSVFELFSKAHSDVLSSGDYDNWKPKLQDEIEDYIKANTSKAKSFSMKGELNKAIFTATYLFHLNAYPLALGERHEKMCKKLNMSSGSLTKSLSRISVPLKDCTKYGTKNNVNVFKDSDEVKILEKTAYLMTDTNKKIKGGYLSGYANKVIEIYMKKYWEDKGMEYQPYLYSECRQALVGDKE